MKLEVSLLELSRFLMSTVASNSSPVYNLFTQQQFTVL